MPALESIKRLFTGEPPIEVAPQPPLSHGFWKAQSHLFVKPDQEEEVTPEGLNRLILDESSGKDHLKAYKDSKGIFTIGHGFNLEEPANAELFKKVTGFAAEEAIKGKQITVEQQEALLGHTTDVAEADVKKLVPSFDKLKPEQQDALTNFVFNVGLTTALKFKNTFAAINRGDGKAAANGIRNSAYYRQVGARAERVAKVIETISK